MIAGVARVIAGVARVIAGVARVIAGVARVIAGVARVIAGVAQSPRRAALRPSCHSERGGRGVVGRPQRDPRRPSPREPAPPASARLANCSPRTARRARAAPRCTRPPPPRRRARPPHRRRRAGRKRSERGRIERRELESEEMNARARARARTREWECTHSCSTLPAEPCRFRRFVLCYSPHVLLLFADCSLAIDLSAETLTIHVCAIVAFGSCMPRPSTKHRPNRYLRRDRRRAAGARGRETTREGARGEVRVIEQQQSEHAPRPTRTP